jgi:hypothetical protein
MLNIMTEATYHPYSPKFLSWQVRVPQKRFETSPIYSGPEETAALIGYEVTNKLVKVMKLVGWGTSKKAAETMAENSIK